MKEKKNIPAGNIVATVLPILIIFLNSAMAQQPGIKRTELQRHDLSIPQCESIQVRIDFAAGSKFGRHSHPGEEIIYVLEGLLEYQVADRPPVILKTGDVLFIPKGMKHSARNAGNSNAKELATYIVEKGKPLVVMDN